MDSSHDLYTHIIYNSIVSILILQDCMVGAQCDVYRDSAATYVGPATKNGVR